MTSKPLINKELYKQFIKDYRLGDSQGKICLKFGISEYLYFKILKIDSVKRAQAHRTRQINMKKKKDQIKKGLQGGKSTAKEKKAKPLTPEEKIAELERKLKHEKKKNQELEGLLKVAKEHLGKF